MSHPHPTQTLIGTPRITDHTSVGNRKCRPGTEGGGMAEECPRMKNNSIDTRLQIFTVQTFFYALFVP